MLKRNIIELVSDGAETVFDQIVKDSLLKDIPIVGSISKMCNIRNSIRDRLYTEKIKVFLVALDDIPLSKKKEFSISMISGGEDIEKLTQKIMLIIESQSDIEKSEIIASLFVAYLDGEISNIDFRRSLDVTSGNFLDDLTTFLEYGNGQGIYRVSSIDIERSGISALVSSALINVYPRNELESDGITLDGDIIDYYLDSEFGKIYRGAFHFGQKLRYMKMT